MKKILSYCLVATIALAMASCDGDPFAGKPFHIFVSDITPFGATIQIVPTDKETHYFWALEPAEDVDDYSTIEAFYKHSNYGIHNYKGYAETGDVEYVVPSSQSGYSENRKPNTEYVIIVFHLDEEYNPDFANAVTCRFTTLFPEGGLKAWFTVGNKSKVLFSKANLCYDRSDGKYYFLDNQWDYIGDKADYASGTGKIDLFGWGTGNEPLNTSTNIDDYTDFADWGDHAIVNGGNAAKQWRTLSNDEWGHVCALRDRADELIGFGVVHGVNGLILLPDGWQKTVGLPDFKPLKQALTYYEYSITYQDPDKSNNDYEMNVYTDQQWEALEKSGALFLPAVGWRSGTDCYDIGWYGNYWSKDPYNSSSAYDLYFEKYRFGAQGGGQRYHGRSVRLVCNIE